ncbi:MAG: exo-alpha-sialidase [Slackia sp.]|nr:exo-alpha-sialidase [Slackia sp.]
MNTRKFGNVVAASLLATTMTVTAVPAFAVEEAAAPSSAQVETPAAAASVLSASTRALQGQTVAQPFVAGQTGTSQHFRIPSILTLDNGWLLAGADARWNSYGDSPNNLDGLVSLSKDGGATWEWQLVNEFVDCASSNAGGNNNQSASFIDPTFIQDSSGTIYMVADAWPANAGIWGTGGGRCDITGFDENGNFLLAKGQANTIATLDGSAYTYYADAAAAREYTVDGKQVRLLPIKDAQGVETGSWIDVYYDLYEVKDGVASASMTTQQGTGAPIQNNVFYKQSEFKAYPTCYLWLVTGKVTGDGIAWSDPTVLNVKRPDDQPFTGICPGRGLVVPLENGGERVMFQVYESKQGGHEAASAIWTDDGGATWQRGGRADQFNGAGKSSESQTVLLPNGDVRMYSRNAAGYISYCDSKDGGATWGPYTLDKELAYTSNCMVSFINVDGALIGPDGRVYDNLIAASYPKTSGRQDGVIRIGSIDAATNKVTWLNPATVKYPGKYLYSCLTQTDEGLALVYENQSANDGSKDVVFERFAIADVMGEGWTHTAAAPDVRLSVDDLAIDAGESAPVSLNVEGIENAAVRWSLKSDTPVEVARLDREQTAAGEAVTVTGVATGKATLIASVDAVIDGTSFTLTDSARVYVSADGVVVLPDEYDKPITADPFDAYVVQEEQIADGDYLVYSDKAPDGAGRILYLHTGSTTDRLKSSIDQGCILPDQGGKFPLERQQWHFQKTDAGYTVKNVGGNVYLNVTGAHAAGLPYSETPTYFSLEKGQNGRWLMSADVDGTRYYVGQETARGNFVATAEKNDGIVLGLSSQAYTVQAPGLEALLHDAAALTDEQTYTPETWQAFAQARDEAQAVYDEQVGRHNAKADADAAVAALSDARESLYRAMQDLLPRSEVEYTLTLKIEGSYFTDDVYEPLHLRMGEKIELPAAVAHEGYEFDGWSGVPEDGLMPEGDLVVVGSYSKAAVVPPAENPTPQEPEGTTPAPNPVPADPNGSSAAPTTPAPSASAQQGAAFAKTGDTVAVLAGFAGVIAACAAGLAWAARRLSRRS